MRPLYGFHCLPDLPLMYLHKDKVETLLAKEILTCGFHRMRQNQICTKNYTLFGLAIFKPKKIHSESLISSGSGTYTDALSARHATSESFIHFRELAIVIFQMNTSLWSWLFSFKSNYACLSIRAGNGDFSGYHEDDAELLSWEIKGKDLAPVVQKLDNAIHRISHYPEDKYYENQLRYPLDSNLSTG